MHATHGFWRGPDDCVAASAGPGDPADFVTVKIYPRVAAALEFRPIPISLTFAAEPGSELHQKLEAFDKYGIPFVAPHGTVSGTLDLPGGLDGSFKGGSIRIGPSPDAGVGYQLGLARTAPDGTVAQQVILDMQPVSVGFDRTGIRAHGTDQDEVFDVHILTDLKTEVVNFSLSTRDLTGRHPDDLLKSLRFLESFRAPNKLAIAAPRGPITNPPIDLGAARTWIDPQSVEANLQIVTLLAELQDYTTEQLLVPAAETIDRSTVLAWRSALRLLRGETLTLKQREVRMCLHPGAEPAAEPFAFAIEQPLTIPLGKDPVILGTQLAHCTHAVGELESVPEHEEHVDCIVRSADGVPITVRLQSSIVGVVPGHDH